MEIYAAQKIYAENLLKEAAEAMSLGKEWPNETPHKEKRLPYHPAQNDYRFLGCSFNFCELGNSVEINLLRGKLCTITDMVFFRTVIEVFTTQQNTPHHITSHHNTSHPTPHPMTTPLFASAEIQAHFMPSGMMLAQEHLDNCFFTKRAIRQPTNGTAHGLWHSREREPTNCMSVYCHSH